MTKQQTTLTTALSLAIIVFVLLISGRLWTRLDLTAHKSWTISPVSKQLANEITDQLHITYFVSDKLKKLYTFPAEISDLIGEYVSFSHGKIRFTERDPAKTGLENQMVDLGIESREFQVIEKDEASFSNIYTGILIEYQGKNEVLPFVFRLDTLEYELTNRIRYLIREREKIAGILVGDEANAFNTDNNYQNLQRWLTQAGYQTRVLTEDEAISDTLTELFVIGGTGVFDDSMLYQIDRYIQNGGKVFFALKGVNVTAAQGYSAQKIEDTRFLDMIASYGVTVEQALVLDPSCLLTASSSPAQRGLRMAVRYPFYVHILPESGNADHPVTSVFQGVDLYWPNPLVLQAPEGIEAVPLFTSTADAWLQESFFSVDPQMSSQFSQGASETQGSKILGAALSGKFPSYWRGRPKPEREGLDEPLPDLPGQSENARIIAVGNADFLMGNVDFLFSQYAQAQPNLNFAVMAADWLSNDEDILSIRSRIPATGMLDKIIEPEARQSAFALVKFINMVLVPCIVLVFAILLSMRRKKAAARLQAYKETTHVV